MIMCTLGPWKLWPTHWAGGWGEHSKLPNRIRIQPKDSSRILAYVEHHGTGNGQDVYPTDKDYANARLIAAAPDLLEACKSLVRSIVEASKHSPHQQYAIEIAEAAIAKAEGAQP